MVEFALLVSSAEQRGRRSRAEEREGLGCMGGGGETGKEEEGRDGRKAQESSELVGPAVPNARS